MRHETDPNRLSYLDVIRAASPEDVTLLTLQRTYQAAVDSEKDSFAVLPFEFLPLEANESPAHVGHRVSSICHDIRSLGLGTLRLTLYRNEPVVAARPVVSTATSLCIPGLSRHQTVRLMKKADVPAACYAGLDSKHDVMILQREETDK